ncbi:MAG: tRNA 2-thiouridine(34) synthase MnmA [Angelakisella sp.]
MMSKKVLVAMSGGVDSSVAAYLLREKGYQVAGATFRLWGNADNAVNDARQVCAQLGIAHYVLDMQELFRRQVVDAFVREYQQGKTPNPCVFCNRYIKFSAFLEQATALGFDEIATGHYAQIIRNNQSSRYELQMAVHPEKDQSYVLYPLTQQQLEHCLMPLGRYPKDEIRRIAEQKGLLVAGKPDSQDICFVPDGDYGAFLEHYTGEPARPGMFVDRQGKVLGAHKGLERYTVGQRKGLGISLGQPAFVSDISTETGNITLDCNQQVLFKTEVTVGELNWVSIAEQAEPFSAQVRLRYSQKAALALVTPSRSGGVTVRFAQPQRAPTKGQSAVLYDGTRVLAGGVIVDSN